MTTFEQQFSDSKLRVGKYGEDEVISRQITMGPPDAPEHTGDNPATFHDSYTEYRPWFELARDSYYSSGGFLTGERLAKFSVAEPDERYKVRQARAYHISIVRLLANVYVNAIYGTNIVRNFSRLPIDPTKWRGPRGSWESTMRFWLLQKVLYGGSLCGLDRKTADPVETLQDEKDNPLVPFVISPLRAIDWSLNGTEFAWVKIQEKPGFNRGMDWRNPKNVEDAVKVWTPDSWYKFNDTGAGWDETTGENGLGQVPIVPMIGDYPEDPGSFYGATDFLQVAKINLRMFNLFSEGDDQMASSA
ncbi:MAG: hypothetical protein KDC71_24615, partial [Acidobacteria bacterium]|nr:hypothetical protein [Acidobacteriota bacterium]